MDRVAEKLDISSNTGAHADIVPSFFLFGEPPRATTGRFLHVEALDARSRPNGWNIAAHAHGDLHHLFLIERGAGVMRIEAATTQFAAPVLILVPAGTVHGFTYAEETAGTVLTIATSYLSDLIEREPAFAALFASGFAIDLDTTAIIAPALKCLTRELGWNAPGHTAAVEGQLLVVLVEALRRQVHARAATPPARGAATALVARFREAVENSYRLPRSVDAYATDLGVLPARLRSACVRVAGTTPAAIVRDRQMLEARRALLYSNMTVAEVAYHLGFDDPAYFTRVFTRVEGRSPRRFRADGLSRASPVPASG